MLWQGVWKLDCDSLNGLSNIFENKKLIQQDWRSNVYYSLVGIFTYVNNNCFSWTQSNQSGKQLKKPETKKKELMGKNKSCGGGGGGGMEKQMGWDEWLNILAIATHAKQIKTQIKRKLCIIYTCLVRYENTAWRQCHQTKHLQVQVVTEKQIISDHRQTKMAGIFWTIQMKLQTRNNINPGTANIKTCHYYLMIAPVSHLWWIMD